MLGIFDRPDDEIRDEVAKDIMAEFAPDSRPLDVSVSCGIVTITGQVESRAIAPHLITAIRHAEGVVGVRDRLSYRRAGQQRRGRLRRASTGGTRCPRRRGPAGTIFEVRAFSGWRDVVVEHDRDVPAVPIGVPQEDLNFQYPPVIAGLDVLLVRVDRQPDGTHGCPVPEL